VIKLRNGNILNAVAPTSALYLAFADGKGDGHAYSQRQQYAPSGISLFPRQSHMATVVGARMNDDRPRTREIVDEQYVPDGST
jgi:hypothetical protein